MIILSVLNFRSGSIRRRTTTTVIIIIIKSIKRWILGYSLNFSDVKFKRNLFMWLSLIILFCSFWKYKLNYLLIVSLSLSFSLWKAQWIGRRLFSNRNVNSMWNQISFISIQSELFVNVQNSIKEQKKRVVTLKYKLNHIQQTYKIKLSPKIEFKI